ncbi:MAG TPA: hypothetical protein VI168_10740 [Croceibacterium sp.]
MTDEPDRVVVRMYRGVLGDCFLLTVWQGGKPRVAMIDCGVLQNVRPGPEMVERLPRAVIDAVGEDRLAKVEGTWDAVRAIGKDIVAYLAGIEAKLDLVVITHDHYDHVAGFTLPDVENVFLQPEFEIGQLWLSWVENPLDTQARALAARFSKRKEAVALAAEVGRQAMGALSDSLDQVQALAAFIGPVEHPGLPAVPASTKTTTQSIQAMREKVGANTRFLEPGQVIAPEDGIGLKTYVLAPPRSDKRLFKDLPTGEGEDYEVYLTADDEAAAIAGVAFAQLHGLAAAGQVELEEDQRKALEDKYNLDPLPFARPHRRPYPPEAHGKRERSTEWRALRAAYEGKANAWRSISGDWTEAADTLALKLDSDTNNASLVLAFELPDGGILLFPGDAQIGNWESWGDQLYPATPVGGERQQTIEQILGRVVFYKVGHHASHNATARGRGLELMTDERLCAAIPVVEAVARIQGPGKKTAGKGWKMPFEHLYARLEEKTEGRVVRGDGDPASEAAAFAKRDTGVTISHENSAAGGRWVELTFPLAKG